MDGIVAIQQQQQQQQPSAAVAAAAAARRKEWRVVSEGGGGAQQQHQKKLFEAAAVAAPAAARMSHPQVRQQQRYPGPSSSRPRNGRVYPPDAENVNSDKLAAKNEEHGDQALEAADAHIDDLQHRLSEISRQREHLQQVELDLQVRFFARNEILRLQASFDEQAKQHNEIVSGLQEQLHQREEQMQEMQQHSEERERQLQMEANDVRNQVWAKDALIRDQTNELATLRRERDNALAENKSNTAQLDAERADHHAEVESLKEQIRDKERRLQELEEQDILFPNDKQLRDAQLWMARSQELEAYHMNAIHAELRERTEQMTQLWVSCQRQVSDVERYYQQVIQKLQQDLETNHFVRNKEMTIDGSGMRGSKAIEQGMAFHHKLPVIHMEGAFPMMIPPDGLPPVEHATGLPVLTAPVLGMTSVVPPSPSIPQYGAVQPVSTMPFPQPVPVLISQRPPMKHQQPGAIYHPSQIVQRQQRPIEQKHAQSSSEESNPQLKVNEVEQPSMEQERSQMEKMFSGLSSQRHPYMDREEVTVEMAPPKQQGIHCASFNSVIERSKSSPHVNSKTEQSAAQPLENGHQVAVKTRDLEQSHEDGPVREEASVSVSSGSTSEANGSISDLHLMDRDSLLACLVRVIPAEPSAKIRISTTLPNRLAKVLAPLHWHDYRKHYGRLGEFVEAHSQLFVVEGDYVFLREGAHAIVSATTAVAKAAAAVPSSRTVQAPTVALTPVAQAQSQRSRSSKALNADSTSSSSSTSSPQEKRRETNPALASKANGNYASARSVNSTVDEKRSGSFKENGGHSSNGYGNGVLDGYVNYNAATTAYFKNRDGEIGARPQTQEGRILETV
ncbi:uncharacterized protein LOC112346663 isoform X2 [Selaginella moellendorffii]|uniref:uncharacterized protein LOC112346663 isoform X2 n=1 Tax=Selaginella moellendorffii TaxID=88036 RepID=UPI000D1C8654|nr:uncharacterized protein LOC112346663 isoform X2 [Selaginella moellendorffii]|eukprot:XP_024531929.1 uncharacterized protein LOC112346663 isoform X2 [Selaginella moellendorffii]